MTTGQDLLLVLSCHFCHTEPAAQYSASSVESVQGEESIDELNKQKYKVLYDDGCLFVIPSQQRTIEDGICIRRGI